MKFHQQVFIVSYLLKKQIKIYYKYTKQYKNTNMIYWLSFFKAQKRVVG